MTKTIHHGHNIKRFREMLGIKQEALAFDLGDDWNQKKISILEQKERVDEQLLDKIAKQLKVPAEAIKNFDEEMAIYNIQNNYEGSNAGASGAIGPVGTQNNECTFNPLDKYVAAMEKNEQLYERMLQIEREKNELLQKIIDNRLMG